MMGLLALSLWLTPMTAAAQSLPSGWASADIGSPQLSGSASYTGSTYSVTGAGVDIWNNSDQFRFAYRQLTGDGVIVARVATLQQAHVWSKAGVMIRESLSAGSKHAFAVVSSAKGLSFQRRLATSGVSYSNTGLSGAAPRWVRLERKGSTFTASVSTDGASWQTLGTDTITMGATVYVGLALTSHNAGARVTATFTNVAVTTTPTTPTNTPPTVAITAPAGGATVSGAVAIRGTAADTAGVAKVEVRVDSGAFATVTGTTNWSTSWTSTSVANGAHTLTVRATDTGGLTATASVAVTVANGTSTGTAAGTIPAGYPKRFAMGLFEDNGRTWMRDSGTKWDVRYRYLVQGWVNNWGWSPADGSFALSFMRESAQHGFVPSLQFYVMNGVSGYNESAFLSTAQNASRMADYFGQWKILMQRARDFGQPVVVMVEADGFGFLYQQASANPNAYAAVAATGLPELASLPNTVAGWGLAFLEIRAAVGAHNAILAMDISGWGTGKDILYFSVTDPLQAEVDKAYNFLAPLGLAANQTGETWDLLAQNPLDRDSDYYTTLGQNRWWDASDSASISSRSFNRYAEWLRLWNVKAQKRWVLWQVPLGNSNHSNVYNNGGAREGYKDNRPEYFLGANGDAHRRKFAQAGVIGVFFGAGASGMSQYTNDYYTDGQLFMRSRGASFLNSGGLPIE
jgi:regulation of enolase protein 1 (concanavalin A-like superfamily)